MSKNIINFKSIYSEMKKDSSGFVKKANLIGEFMHKNNYSKAQTYRIFLEEEKDWEEINNGKSVLLRLKIKACEGITLHGLPCRSKQRNAYCEHETGAFCQMHCDCEICGKYHPTYNQGKYYQEEKKVLDKEGEEHTKYDWITNETDIDKLKCLLRAISEDVKISSYIPRAKIIYKNREIVEKIESYQDKINQLRRQIR